MTDYDTAEPSQIEALVGVTFDDKSLLQRALTHRSYLNEQDVFAQLDNERLEYLGDAVLDFLIGEHLYHRLPEVREGQLTALRAALVCRETLARVAARLNLGDYLRMGRGEVESGGRERPAILCATLEALIGAIYLDKGLWETQAFVLRTMADELAQAQASESLKDAKSRLQELTQGHSGVTPQYRTVSQRGPDHAKEFTVEVVVGGVPMGQGNGRTKQAAAQAAAAAAIERIVATGMADMPVAADVAVQEPES